LNNKRARLPPNICIEDVGVFKLKNTATYFFVYLLSPNDGYYYSRWKPRPLPLHDWEIDSKFGLHGYQWVDLDDLQRHASSCCTWVQEFLVSCSMLPYLQDRLNVLNLQTGADGDIDAVIRKLGGEPPRAAPLTTNSIVDANLVASRPAGLPFDKDLQELDVVRLHSGGTVTALPSMNSSVPPPPPSPPLHVSIPPPPPSSGISPPPPSEPIPPPPPMHQAAAVFTMTDVQGDLIEVIQDPLNDANGL
jgi:hypothetical protein